MSEFDVMMVWTLIPAGLFAILEGGLMAYVAIRKYRYERGMCVTAGDIAAAERVAKRRPAWGAISVCGIFGAGIGMAVYFFARVMLLSNFPELSPVAFEPSFFGWLFVFLAEGFICGFVAGWLIVRKRS